MCHDIADFTDDGVANNNHDGDGDGDEDVEDNATEIHTGHGHDVEFCPFFVITSCDCRVCVEPESHCVFISCDATDDDFIVDVYVCHVSTVRFGQLPIPNVLCNRCFCQWQRRHRRRRCRHFKKDTFSHFHSNDSRACGDARGRSVVYLLMWPRSRHSIWTNKGMNEIAPSSFYGSTQIGRNWMPNRIKIVRYAEHFNFLRNKTEYMTSVSLWWRIVLRWPTYAHDISRMNAAVILIKRTA